jgi:hypothetical protein
VKNARAHLLYPPPPLAVPGEGTLLLGFKQFEPGPHSGAFEVTIRRGGRTRVVNHLDS